MLPQPWRYFPAPWPRGHSCEVVLDRAAEGRIDETRIALEPANYVTLQPSGFAQETLQAAVYFVHRATSFEDALVVSLLFAGGANYAPVLVRAIGGAHWGARQIPASELGHCFDRNRVARVRFGIFGKSCLAKGSVRCQAG